MIKLLYSFRVGKFISTKVPDGKPYKEAADKEEERPLLSELKRLDLTHEYKFPEGKITKP